MKVYTSHCLVTQCMILYRTTTLNFSSIFRGGETSAMEKDSRFKLSICSEINYTILHSLVALSHQYLE